MSDAQGREMSCIVNRCTRTFANSVPVVAKLRGEFAVNDPGERPKSRLGTVLTLQYIALLSMC